MLFLSTNSVQRIINRLRELDMLYVAPKGSNDDWYWLYSTVYEGRKTPAYVVSNDYMRDHRATFAESRAFLRWRSSQIVYFSFSKAVEPGQLANAAYTLPTVSLYRPGTFLCFCKLACSGWFYSYVPALYPFWR
jgi:hypothetical protein